MEGDKSFPGRKNSMYKGPEAEKSLENLKDSKEASMVGA